ncbi:hypothetical protein D3C76_27630 [compost metagenome]
MENVTRVIAAVLDKSRLIMYKPDGTTLEILQGDPRIKHLTDKVFPDIDRQEFSDLSEQDLENPSENYSHYAETEAQLGGMVKFFRMLKTEAEKVLALFAEDGFNGVKQAGEIPAPGNQDEEEEGTTQPQTKSQAAVAQIMAQAAPASSPEFQQMSKEQAEETTVVAVTEDGTCIPGIEQIDVQLKAIAAKLGSPEGIANFFRRVTSVKRAHTVQDLLKFMEKGELPIADDGSVLVYKRLRSTDEAGVFVDCHTRTVKQRVGSFVFMDDKLVDPNRYNECSNGLHVARRDYLNSFSGDVTVLAKLAPEDVIAVPHGDARKLRARGYHIVVQLSAADANLVNGNRPMQDTVLLGNVAAGNHVDILEHVQILDQQRTDKSVKYTTLSDAETVQLDGDKKSGSLETLDKDAPVHVDAASVAKKKPAGTKKAEIKRPIDTLIDAFKKAKSDKAKRAAASNIVVFKKNAKKGWDKLGVSDELAKEITELVPLAQPAKPVKEAKPEPVIPATGTPKERIAAGLGHKPLTRQLALDILQIKKASKKGWSALGVTAAQEKEILKLASK